MRTSSTHSSRRPPTGAQPATAHRIRLIIIAGLFMLGLLALAACGGSAPGIIGPTPPYRTPPVTTPGATGTPGIGRYAYLYSRVDYPLQVPVNAGDTVTLTLSPLSNILTVTPSPGSGSESAAAPIPLPTDLSLYRDIGAEADTVDTAKSPVVWQLVSPPRQSLLTGPDVTSHQYQQQVTFHWHVQAVGPGENSINIVIRLYYIYLDGSEHDGTIQMTQQPIPIVAVQPSPISNSLPSAKLPIAGITWLAGFLAVLRFIWKAYQTINDVAEPVKQAAQVAVAVKKHMGSDTSGSDQSPQPPAPTAPNGYPNPWAQPRTWQSPPQATPPAVPPDTTRPNGRQRPFPPPAPPPSGPSSSWPPSQQPPSGPPRNSGGW